MTPFNVHDHPNIVTGQFGDRILTVSDGEVTEGNFFAMKAIDGADATVKAKSAVNFVDDIITFAEALRVILNAHSADAVEHGTSADAVNFPLSSATATNLSTLITLVTEMLDEYEDHHDDAVLASSWAFHNAQFAGSTGTLASVVAPTTLQECYTRLLDIQAKFNIHDTSAVAHTAGSTHQDNDGVSDPGRQRDDFATGGDYDGGSALTIVATDYELGHWQTISVATGTIRAFYHKEE